MSIVSLKPYIAALNSGNMDTVIENTYYLQDIFDTYYLKVDQSELVSVMNRLIEICVSCGNGEIEDQIMDTLELGAGRNGIQNVDFDPLVKMFENEKNYDRLWHLVIILGGSLQPEYIEFLNNIKTNDTFLRKEIDDAVYELKYSKYDDL